MKRTRLFILASAALVLIFGQPAPARAGNCSNPTAVEGKQVYNSTYHVMMFCNGTNWIAMGLATTGGGGGGSNYTGPGDIVSGAIAWYGLRAYSAAVAATGTQKAIKIRRASDNTTMDILILTSGALDTATASTFCASTTCRVTEAYDQTGNGNHVLQATKGQQPQLVFNCIGSLPCLQFTGSSSQTLSVSLIVPQPLTLSGTAEYTGGASQGDLMASSDGFSPSFGFAGNTVSEADDSSFISAAYVPGTFSAMQGVFHGASSAIYVNGAQTSGSVGNQSLSSAVGWGSWTSGGYLTGELTEVGIWALAFNTSQQSSMNANQRSYWGF